METRQRLRKGSKESRPDITDDPDENNSLQTFLTCKGFIRRHLRDFFQSIQRVRGTKVSPFQAEDHQGSGLAQAAAFDAVVPKVVEPRPPPESAMQSLRDYDTDGCLQGA